MVRLVLLIPVLLAACTAPQQQAATCYRIVENVVTEEGARALMQVPCPEGQSGILLLD
jgi:nitrous oxide reductase accessory protein NosL